MHFQMRPDRKYLIPAAVALAFLTIFGAILLTLWVARQQSVSEQKSKADLLAAEVLRRVDVTGGEVTLAVRRLEREHPDAAPCSPEKIRLMGNVTLTSDEVIGAGFITNDRLVCTLLGELKPGLPVGKPDYISNRGAIFRTNVKLPFTGSPGYILISGLSGYAVIVHPRLARDVFREDPRSSIGVFGTSSRRLVNVAGAFDRSWLRKYFDRGLTTYVDHGRIVAVRPSMQGDYSVFAILPARSITETVRRYALFLVAGGMVMAALLGFVMTYVVRTQNSFATILRNAIRTREFHCEYQPIVELATGRWVGAECLLRWRRKTGENVRPDLFIGAAEEAGVIGDITAMVCDIIGSEVDGTLHDHPDFYITINASATDLNHDRMTPLLETLVRRTRSEPCRFVVEATERGLIDSEDGRAAVDRLRALGFRVALDDFGTGYSSLSYLQTFALDFIKIDKFFVESVKTEAATSNVVSHIINMARDLNLEIVAEGVETEAQARFLQERGVRYAQGWYFARSMHWPMLMAELAARRSMERAA
ncbi:MAG TPA: EAL domain-containing protein [Sphingomonas sp.]|uniref:EAL domain-containing protein n=1 Tax=Sphingomonas sp. TaxID=28214 RepID=UPI002CA33AF7|nr:EAL domain-containing protein [Sphingomonas sp.]HMI18201.1 EAL domain-containing protein [Sphingomonas sp.]